MVQLYTSDWKKKMVEILQKHGWQGLDIDGVNLALKKWVYHTKFKCFSVAMRQCFQAIGISYVHPLITNKPFSTALFVDTFVDVQRLIQTLLHKCLWTSETWRDDPESRYKGYLQAFFMKHQHDQGMIHSFLQFLNSQPYEIPKVTGTRSCSFRIKKGGTHPYGRQRDPRTGMYKDTLAKGQLPLSHACTSQITMQRKISSRKLKPPSQCPTWAMVLSRPTFEYL